MRIYIKYTNKDEMKILGKLKMFYRINFRTNTPFLSPFCEAERICGTCHRVSK